MSLEEYINRQMKVPVHEFENSMPPPPLVSICVITYNHKDYIKDCLNGILMQQCNFDYEILLGDDDSNDGTREICIEYAKKFPEKFRLFLHHRENNIKINGKPTGRFNIMYNFYKARGKYIALCEGDDYWTDPLKLQKQVDFLEANDDYVLTTHWNRVVYESEKGPLKRVRAHTASLVFRSSPIPSFIKDSIANGFGGDIFFLTYMAQFGKFRLLEFEGAVYRWTGKGAWSKQEGSEKKFTNSIKYYTRMRMFFEEKGFIGSLEKLDRDIVNYKIAEFRERESFSIKDYLQLFKEVYKTRNKGKIRAVIAVLLKPGRNILKLRW